MAVASRRRFISLYRYHDRRSMTITGVFSTLPTTSLMWPDNCNDVGRYEQVLSAEQEGWEMGMRILCSDTSRDFPLPGTFTIVMVTLPNLLWRTSLISPLGHRGLMNTKYKFTSTQLLSFAIVLRSTFKPIRPKSRTSLYDLRMNESFQFIHAMTSFCIARIFLVMPLFSERLCRLFLTWRN